MGTSVGLATTAVLVARFQQQQGQSGLLQPYFPFKALLFHIL
jgi:hypothetical protein